MRKRGRVEERKEKMGRIRRSGGGWLSGGAEAARDNSGATLVGRDTRGAKGKKKKIMKERKEEREKESEKKRERELKKRGCV